MNHGTKSAFSHRLNEALDDANVPDKYAGRQVAVGKMFGVTQKGARKWLEGEGMPSFDKAIEIATRLGVYVEWLWSGRGPKRLGDASPPNPLETMPPEPRQATMDFIEFQLTKIYSGETLTSYMRWVDHMRRNPPGSAPPPPEVPPKE